MGISNGIPENTSRDLTARGSSTPSWAGTSNNGIQGADSNSDNCNDYGDRTDVVIMDSLNGPRHPMATALTGLGSTYTNAKCDILVTCLSWYVCA